MFRLFLDSQKICPWVLPLHCIKKMMQKLLKLLTSEGHEVLRTSNSWHRSLDQETNDVVISQDQRTVTLEVNSRQSINSISVETCLRLKNGTKHHSFGRCKFQYAPGSAVKIPLQKLYAIQPHPYLKYFTLLNMQKLAIITYSNLGHGYFKSPLNLQGQYLDNNFTNNYSNTVSPKCQHFVK